MRSYDPTDEDDIKEAVRLTVEPWMLDLLSMNPSYTLWGPYEDYMAAGGQWNSPVVHDRWSEYEVTLDELNELVNFYFEVERESIDCETCAGTGTHPHARWVSESFYHHSSPFTTPTVQEQQAAAIMSRFGGGERPRVATNGYPPADVLGAYGPAFTEFCERMKQRGDWNDDITQEEVQALIDAGRIRDPSATVEQVNATQHQVAGGLLRTHDAINRWVLVEARCKRFGIPYRCPDCEGHGSQFTAPSAHVGLVLWVLHPRKGCSRGWHIKRVEQSDLPAVFAHLRAAAERNAQRFARIPTP